MIRAGVRRFLHLALRRRDRWEREVEDEIKLHLSMRAEQLMAEGRSADDAYAEAVRRFGPLSESRARLIEAAHHREGHMQRTEYLDDLRQDVSFALRALRRQKGWAAVTVLTLALGIGATTAVFSVVSTLLLHPLAYPNPDRIVFIDLQPTQGNNTGINVTVTPPTSLVRSWRDAARSVETFVGASIGPRPLKTASGEPGSASVAATLPNFFDFAGARPLLGRRFTQQDIDAGAPVALLGETFWRNRLGGDSSAIGKSITLGDSSFVVIGVIPDTRFGHASSAAPDVWIPLDIRNDKLGMTMMARLRPGVTREAAARELDTISARTTLMKETPFRTIVSAPAERVRFQDSLYTLAAAVALVLLVACANVAHLLLARSTTRARELAIRAALGAGRGRLLRQLLTESLLVTFAGTAVGVFVGWIGLKALIAMRPRSLDALAAARLDTTTLGLAVTLAVLSGIVFAVIGAAQSRRSATPETLRTSGAGHSGARHDGRTRGLLIVSEMALSATLLVGATLLVRSVMRLQRADLGFQPRGLYAISLPLDPRAFDADAVRVEFQRALMSRVTRMPQVRAATLTPVPPGVRMFTIGRLEIDGEPPPDQSTTSFIDILRIQNNYFSTMGVPLVFGTIFTDTTPAAHQLIVNASWARKHWKNGAAIGRRVRVAQNDSTPWMTIVGVAGDVRSGGPLGESSAPVFYSPYDGRAGNPFLIVRTDGGAAALAPIADVARQLGLKRPQPPDPVMGVISRSIAAPKFVMALLTILTSLAVILAAIGLYGVMAYAVAQQTREIGIRVALGATEERIARAVVGRGAALALVGALVGLTAAVWGTKLIEKQLYGVERLDPLSYAIGGMVLIAAALLACVVPTRRALAVDPMTAIRAD